MLVAAIIGAVSSIGLAGTVRAGVERAVCEITGGSYGGSCPAAGTVTPTAAPGTRSAPLNPSPADIRQAEQQAFGGTRLVDACAAGPSATGVGYRLAGAVWEHRGVGALVKPGKPGAKLFGGALP